VATNKKTLHPVAAKKIMKNAARTHPPAAAPQPAPMKKAHPAMRRARSLGAAAVGTSDLDGHDVAVFDIERPVGRPVKLVRPRPPLGELDRMLVDTFENTRKIVARNVNELREAFLQGPRTAWDQVRGLRFSLRLRRIKP
jgi:hypothetical protein